MRHIPLLALMVLLMLSIGAESAWYKLPLGTNDVDPVSMGTDNLFFAQFITSFNERVWCSGAAVSGLCAVKTERNVYVGRDAATNNAYTNVTVTNAFYGAWTLTGIDGKTCTNFHRFSFVDYLSLLHEVGLLYASGVWVMTNLVTADTSNWWTRTDGAGHYPSNYPILTLINAMHYKKFGRVLNPSTNKWGELTNGEAFWLVQSKRTNAPVEMFTWSYPSSNDYHNDAVYAWPYWGSEGFAGPLVGQYSNPPSWHHPPLFGIIEDSDFPVWQYAQRGTNYNLATVGITPYGWRYITNGTWTYATGSVIYLSSNEDGAAPTNEISTERWYRLADVVITNCIGVPQTGDIVRLLWTNSPAIYTRDSLLNLYDPFFGGSISTTPYATPSTALFDQLHTAIDALRWTVKPLDLYTNDDAVMSNVWVGGWMGGDSIQWTDTWQHAQDYVTATWSGRVARSGALNMDPHLFYYCASNAGVQEFQGQAYATAWKPAMNWATNLIDSKAAEVSIWAYSGFIGSGHRIWDSNALPYVASNAWQTAGTIATNPAGDYLIWPNALGGVDEPNAPPDPSESADGMWYRGFPGGPALDSYYGFSWGRNGRLWFLLKWDSDKKNGLQYVD
jgi:hypothetical protein